MRCGRVLAGVVAVGLVLAACGSQGHLVTSASQPSPVTHGKIVYTGNFADPSQGWPTSSNPNQSSSVNGGQYNVQLKTAGSASPAPSFNGVAPSDLLDVAVSTTVQPTFAGPGDAVGVFCRSIQGHAYFFALSPGSTAGLLGWAITRADSDGTTTKLASGTTPKPSQPSLSIEGDCVGGHANQNHVLVVISLNGQTLGQANDTQLPAPFYGLAGLSVASAKGNTSATFSSFQVQAAS
jgi:hypothetical protein